jgi:XTP/dITP diphosphohydrolase
MKEIVIATRNIDKKNEIKKLLADCNIEVLSLSDFPDIPEIKENGSTFEENAVAKALACAKKTKKLTLADDSGLEVPYLRGKPGVRSARFAGDRVSYGDNNEKLLRLLRNVPQNKRKARFVCCIALADTRGLIKVVRGTCSGKIAATIRGSYGFGYDPIFIPRGYSRTFAELGEKVKNNISHRWRALRKAKKTMAEYFEKYSLQK